MAATFQAPTAPWPPEFLAHVLLLTPDQVLVTGNDRFGGSTRASRREWQWIQTAQRLAWTYGEADALRRINGYGR